MNDEARTRQKANTPPASTEGDKSTPPAAAPEAIQPVTPRPAGTTRRRRNAIGPRMAPPPPLELPPGVTVNKDGASSGTARGVRPTRPRRDAMKPGTPRPVASKASTSPDKGEDQAPALPPRPKKPAPKPDAKEAAEAGPQKSTDSDTSSTDSSQNPPATKEKLKLTGDARKTFFQTNLVQKYKEDKEQEKEILKKAGERAQAKNQAVAGAANSGGGAGGAAPAQQSVPHTFTSAEEDAAAEGGEGSFADTVEEIADSDKLDLVNNILSDTTGTFGTTADLTEAYKGEDDPAAEGMGLASTISGTVTGGIDLGVNALGLYSNARKMHRANKGHNKHEREKQRWSLASSVFNTAGSAVNLGSTLSGFGEGDTADAVGDWMGYAGAGLSTIGAALDTASVLTERGNSASVSNRADAYMKTDEDGSKAKKASEDYEAAKKKNYASEEEKGDELLKMKKARDSAKARKYSMMYAKRKADRDHAATGGALAKSSLGLASSGLGFLGSGAGIILGAFGLDKAKAWTGFGINLASMATKYIGMAIGKHSEKKAEAAKNTQQTEDINKYLEEKVKKIKQEVGEKYNLETPISDNEAKRIALSRLGVNVEGGISDEAVEGPALKDGFNRLMIKRAENILGADDKDKMLDALGLEPGATLKEVAEALGAEF